MYIYEGMSIVHFLYLSCSLSLLLGQRGQTQARQRRRRVQCIYICMRVCVRVYMYVYMCVRVCIYIYIHTYIRIYVCVCVNIYLKVSACTTTVRTYNTTNIWGCSFRPKRQNASATAAPSLSMYLNRYACVCVYVYRHIYKCRMWVRVYYTTYIPQDGGGGPSVTRGAAGRRVRRPSCRASTPPPRALRYIQGSSP